MPTPDNREKSRKILHWLGLVSELFSSKWGLTVHCVGLTWDCTQVICKDTSNCSLQSPVLSHIKAGGLTTVRDRKACLAAEPQPPAVWDYPLGRPCCSSVNRGNRKPNEMRYLASWNSIWKLHFYEHLVMLPPTHKCQMQDPPCPFGQDLLLLLQHFNQQRI